MSIAESLYFKQDHILAHKLDAPPSLAEQAVHCLELVSQLVKTGLSYQFKGGNSLLLILDAPRRFSIDVDIATDETRERIEECLSVLVRDFGVFSRWEKRQHKTKPWLPIASYLLYYQSRYFNPEDSFIMLDVQLRRSPYKTVHKPVVCRELYKSDQSVELPLPASIIGDKLLTLGPTTLGIPVGKGKAAQRLKHVFDISTLLGTRPLLEDIRESFYACLEHENSLQQRVVAVDDVVWDTVLFCSGVFAHEQPVDTGDAMSAVSRENINGLAPFADHLFSKSYTWQDLRSDMLRVALCLTAVFCRHVTQESFADLLQSVAVRSLETPCSDQPVCSGEAVWLVLSRWLEQDIMNHPQRSQYV